MKTYDICVYYIQGVNMKNIKVSIITVCLNSEKTIARAIESVLNQSFKNIEYIIVDGLSNDKTMEIIEKYRNSNTHTMNVMSEKDNGIYDAMNKGIALATGDVIGILNSDDFYEEDAVQSIVNSINFDFNHYVIYGYLNYIDNEKKVSTSIHYHEALRSQPMLHPSTFISKSVYTDYGVYDIKYKCAADYDFFLRLILKSDTNFIPIQKTLANFQLGGMSTNPICIKETVSIKYKYKTISRKQYILSIVLYWIRKKVQRSK